MDNVTLIRLVIGLLFVAVLVFVFVRAVKKATWDGKPLTPWGKFRVFGGGLFCLLSGLAQIHGNLGLAAGAALFNAGIAFAIAYAIRVRKPPINRNALAKSFFYTAFILMLLLGSSQDTQRREREQAKSKLNERRAQLAAEFNQLGGQREKVESIRTKLDHENPQAIQDFNTQVDDLNSAAQRYDHEVEEFNQRLKEFSKRN